MTKFCTKECNQCRIFRDILYRCHFKEMKNWIFVCGKCLKEIKIHQKILIDMVAPGKVKRNKQFLKDKLDMEQICFNI